MHTLGTRRTYGADHAGGSVNYSGGYAVSRSKRKTPIFGFSVADSEKECKRIWHGRMRARERDRIAHDYESLTTTERQVSNVWSMAKDGKHYFPECSDKMMRK